MNREYPCHTKYSLVVCDRWDSPP